MRVNEPITNHEIELPEGTVLVSKTDPQGRITFVNQAFIDISGYTEEELIGAPHNLVRHPHMPPAAFADLWATIKSGKPWEGIVKNRAKNGDHYWVRANATPEITDGEITGFISIRSAPSRAQIDAAEKLYEQIRNGTARNITVTEGRVLGTTLAARLGRLANSITGRLTVIIAVLVMVMILGMGAVLDGMGDSNEALRAVYEHRTVPAGQLADVVDRMRDNLLNAQLLQDELAASNSLGVQKRIARIRANRDHIGAVWQTYRSNPLTEEEKELADEFEQARKSYVSNGLEVAISLAEAKDLEGLRGHSADTLHQLFEEAHQAARSLVLLQLRVAGELYEDAKTDFRHHMRLGFTFLVSGTLLAVLLAVLLVRFLRKPLARLERHFNAIAAGDFVHEIEIEAVAEFQRPNAQLRAMKAKLGYAALERQENAAKAEAHLKKEMLKLTVLLEGEVETTVAEISTQADRLREGAAKLLATAEELQAQSQSMATAIEITSGNVQTVAGATEELEASSREITARIQHSSEYSEAARQRVDAASASVGTLTEATARIGDVASLIQAIAGQTRMLALNATIEAARAGETGKGFAVVASEVKGLAGQTEDAIGRVNAQAQDIERTTREAVTTVEAVAETIRDIDAIAGQVAESAEQQRAATAEIMASAVQAADHTREVAHTAASVLHGAEMTGTTARKVNELSALVSHDIGALQRRLNVILRTSYGGNRRAVERVPVSVEFSAEFGDQRFSGQTGDISVMGALLVVGNAPKLEGAMGTITFPGVGTIPSKAILGSQLGIQCQFVKVSKDQKQAITDAIEAAKARDLPYIQAAQQTAAKVATALEKAVADGRISLGDLFDNDYVPIPDTDPLQLLAKHTALTDLLLPDIIDTELARDPRVVLCCASDRNGYIATHNRKYSEPQRPGDKLWNMAHSRNRRIFDDRTGILASRNTQPYLAQTYVRDMGGGQFMLLKEIDCPIMVGSRHWGALRYALKL
ncbi:chemotaxis protein [Paramagnetospirillum marisnigri]|uniref:Chemotaxis protein n=1 Tax=Paramagnetospirillum marisnigri TaxID=1285242 RepID=A0A178MLU5_9PROT|nr:Tar ligand binding domain-containing protein [Paramagnetospirillum marisnigri]OAN49147.1 chemotaxis protein [Paramagnetospirillum marisnigri]